MLVVIAIIMLLVSMVTPAAQKALESARAVRCRSNLRTMGQALHVTVLESNGRIPRANDVKTEGGVIVDGEWFWHVGAEIAGKTHDEYVTTNEWREEETFACPSVKVRREGPALMQYGMNKYFDPSQSPPSKRGSVEQPYGNFRLSHVRRPSSTYLFGDKTLEDWAPIIHHQGTYLPDPRHNGHAYFVFVDGHVRGEKWPTTVERSHYDFLD